MDQSTENMDKSTERFWETDTVKVSVTFGQTVVFHLRLLSLKEERELREKLFGKDTPADEYASNVSALADLSIKAPEGIDAAKGFSPADQVLAFFAERTIVKERIAHFGLQGFFVRLQPAETTANYIF